MECLAVEAFRTTTPSLAIVRHMACLGTGGEKASCIQRDGGQRRPEYRAQQPDQQRAQAQGALPARKHAAARISWGCVAFVKRDLNSRSFSVF